MISIKAHRFTAGKRSDNSFSCSTEGQKKNSVNRSSEADFYLFLKTSYSLAVKVTKNQKTNRSGVLHFPFPDIKVMSFKKTRSSM